jgi:hypothetical protein
MIDCLARMHSGFPRSRSVYNTDRKYLIKSLRALGKDDCEILKLLLEGVYGEERKKLLLEWANDLGMMPNEILREAFRCGLIPNARMPE